MKAFSRRLTAIIDIWLALSTNVSERAEDLSRSDETESRS